MHADAGAHLAGRGRLGPLAGIGRADRALSGTEYVDICIHRSDPAEHVAAVGGEDGSLMDEPEDPPPERHRSQRLYGQRGAARADSDAEVLREPRLAAEIIERQQEEERTAQEGPPDSPLRHGVGRDERHFGVERLKDVLHLVIRGLGEREDDRDIDLLVGGRDTREHAELERVRSERSSWPRSVPRYQAPSRAGEPTTSSGWPSSVNVAPSSAPEAGRASNAPSPCTADSRGGGAVVSRPAPGGTWRTLAASSPASADPHGGDPD